MTATAQATRPVQGPTPILPTDTSTEQKSLLFVKKLVGIAISNITYLRSIFPEDAYGERSVDGMTVRILKLSKSCPAAGTLIDWIKGTFDAIEKKYVRQLTMAVYLDPNDPDKIIESYAFRFSYTADGVVMSFRDNDMNISHDANSSAQNAARKLIRTLLFTVNELKPLPDDAMLTMKLLYYDEVTPANYEPPGFRPCNNDTFTFERESIKLRVGEVSTKWHAMKLRVQTCEDQLVQVESEPEVLGENRELRSGLDCAEVTQPAVAEQLKQQPMETEDEDVKIKQPTAGDVARGVVSPALPGQLPPSPVENNSQPEHRVICPCGILETSGRMLQCDVCMNFQHAVCYLVLDEMVQINNHTCVSCSNTTSICTEPKLRSMSEAERKACCLYRRALEYCKSTDKVSVPALGREIGTERKITQGIIDRLVKDKVLAAGNGKGGRVVKKENLVRVYPKYMKTAEQEQAEPVQVLAQMTEDMSMRNDEPRRKVAAGKKRKVVKMASGVELDVVDSQDVDSQAGKKRKRSSTVDGISV